MSLHEDRIEKTLGSMTGDYDGQIPEPLSRIEVLIQKILENGGGSGGRGVPGIILNESQYDIHGVPIIDNPIEDVYYMVPNTDSEQGGYIIYMYVDGEWVNTGTTYEQDETVIERVDDLEDNIVLVQNTQPTSRHNKIWIPPEAEGSVEVPTYEEFSELKSAVFLKEYYTVKYWQQGWWGASAGAYDSTHDNAICIFDFISKKAVTINCPTTHKMRLQAWDNGVTYKGIWNGSGFVTQNPLYFSTSFNLDKFRVDYPTYKFKVVLFNADGTSAVPLNVCESVYYTVDAISDNAYDYGYIGEYIDTKVYGLNIQQVKYNLPSPSQYGANSRQDFDVYNGILFQLMRDYVVLINISDGTVVSHFPITCGHGNSCQFGEKDSPDDDFPPLYCFDYESNKVYKNKVTENSATLVTTYVLNGVNGYRYSGGYDSKNGLLISLNYAKNSSTDATDNGIIFAVWDVNDLTDNGDGTYSPALRYTKNLPFIPVVQGCTVFRDRLFVNTGLYPSNYPVKLYVFDYDGNCTSIAEDFPAALSQSEGEGIAFAKSGNDYVCYFAGYSLFIITF